MSFTSVWGFRIQGLGLVMRYPSGSWLNSWLPAAAIALSIFSLGTEEKPPEAPPSPPPGKSFADPPPLDSGAHLPPPFCRGSSIGPFRGLRLTTTVWCGCGCSSAYCPWCLGLSAVTPLKDPAMRDCDIILCKVDEWLRILRLGLSCQTNQACPTESREINPINRIARNNPINRIARNNPIGRFKPTQVSVVQP